MSSSDDLSRAIAELEQLFQQSARLADGDRAGNRLEAVGLRRAIGEKNAAIATIGEQVFASSERRAAFRSEFSRMRSALALHQASWPIVSIVPTDDAYIASLKATREAHRRFVDWVRAALPARP